jgi:hypothetical protein
MKTKLLCIPALFILLAFVFLIPNQEVKAVEDNLEVTAVKLYRNSCSHYNNYWECRSTVSTYECDKASKCD